MIGNKSVEMEPESSDIVRKMAESRGQMICSWYHSHPIFETNPSLIDIQNQLTYQKMFENDNNLPYVGFIVCPYPQSTKSTKSPIDVNCFYVVEDGENHKPYSLEVNVVPQKNIHKRVAKEIKEIFTTSQYADDRIDLSMKWRGNVTKRDKLKKLLRTLINRNNSILESFDMSEITDEDSKEDLMLTSNVLNDENTIEITIEGILAGKFHYFKSGI